MKIDDPKLFFVRDGYTLDYGEYNAPSTRGDAFDFGDYELRSPEALLESANQFPPVMWELQRQYYCFWNTLREGKRTAHPSGANDGTSEEGEIWPEDADEEIIEKWMDQMSDKEVSDLSSAMRVWADSKPDWVNEEGDYFSIPASGQDYALEFFQNYADQEVVEKLGIVIVEGVRPGSTYFAAELRIPIEEANERAEAAGVPVRFKAKCR